MYNHLVTSTTCSLSLSLPRCSSVVASRLDISGCDHTRVPWSFHGLMRMIIVFVIVLLLGCSSTSTINLELLIVSRSHSSYNSYIVLLNFRSTSAKLPPILLVSQHPSLASTALLLSSSPLSTPPSARLHPVSRHPSSNASERNSLFALGLFAEASSCPTLLSYCALLVSLPPVTSISAPAIWMMRKNK